MNSFVEPSVYMLNFFIILVPPYFYIFRLRSYYFSLSCYGYCLMMGDIIIGNLLSFAVVVIFILLVINNKSIYDLND